MITIAKARNLYNNHESLFVILYITASHDWMPGSHVTVVMCHAADTTHYVSGLSEGNPTKYQHRPVNFVKVGAG